MQAAGTGAVIGMIFAIWMFYMSYVEIGALVRGTDFRSWYVG